MHISLITAFSLSGAFASPTNIFNPASTPAESILGLSLFVLEVTGAIFVVVFSLLAYAVVKFRKRSTNDDQEPAQVYGSTQLEIADGHPDFIVATLFWPSARVIASIQNAPQPADAVAVTVTGHQFWWEYRYPGLKVVTAKRTSHPGKRSETPDTQPFSLCLCRYDHSWCRVLRSANDLIRITRTACGWIRMRPDFFWGNVRSIAAHSTPKCSCACTSRPLVKISTDGLNSSGGLLISTALFRGARLALRTDRLYQLPRCLRHRRKRTVRA